VQRLDALAILVQIQKLGPLAAALLGRRIELVVIAELIDQLGRHRLCPQQRPPINRRPHFRFRELARITDRPHQLPVDAVADLGHRLAVSRGKRLLGEHVERVFVLLALIHPRLYAHLVEHAAQKRRLQKQPGQANIPRRLHPHFIERRRQIVGPESV
jgi:hypothetical protein